MSTSINEFMWGYQQHFRVSAEFAAERLLKHFSKKLAPKICLVGYLTGSESPADGVPRHPICVEPEAEH